MSTQTQLSEREMQRTVIIEAIRSLMLEVNGVTGAETIKASKGLRDVYGSVESHLNYTPGKLPEDIKTIVRFEFDKLVSAYTETSNDWKVQSIRQRFGAKEGSAFIKRNASWRNDNVPITAYPQVVAQLNDDVKRFEKHLAEMNAVGNKDGAAKCAGKIRQCKNNALILAGQYDEFVKAQVQRAEVKDMTIPDPKREETAEAVA